MSCQFCQDVYIYRSKNQALIKLNEPIKDLYGGIVRVRVCGICMANHKILLINHSLYGKDGFFWSPPGGGIGFGETAEIALQREFREETGLEVKIGQLLFVNEHIQAPLHAVELFFKIDSFEGMPEKGYDPELPAENQIIADVRFMSWEELRKFQDHQLHSLFSHVQALDEILQLKKYISGVAG